MWHAPLGVRNAKRSHQSPEWTILSHSYRLIQGEIVWSQVLLDSLHPHSSRRPGGFLQYSERLAVMILLASVSSGILLIWPNRERRHAWTTADRRGCPVVRLTSSFRTWCYHLIPNNFRKHHWSRASILSKVNAAASNRSSDQIFIDSSSKCLSASGLCKYHFITSCSSINIQFSLNASLLGSNIMEWCHPSYSAINIQLAVYLACATQAMWLHLAHDKVR